MVATYRLIKNEGHATHVDYTGDVFLQLPRLVFRFPDIGVQGLEHGLCAPPLFSALV
jgi:hypothetical protein